jgi:hypothetical protein
MLSCTRQRLASQLSCAIIHNNDEKDREPFEPPTLTPLSQDDASAGHGRSNSGRQCMCGKTIETPSIDGAASARQQSAVGDAAASKAERIDFLKQAIAFTEWNIRSFDTKAQISIAAFVLSMNPLWAIISSVYARAGSSFAVLVLLLLFVTTVLLYGFVIWPIALTASKLSGSWETKGLFYVGDPNQLTASLYVDRLKTLTIETELAAETLKLASIRQIKSRRFRHALVSTIVFYAGVVVCLLLLTNCGASPNYWACRY